MRKKKILRVTCMFSADEELQEFDFVLYIIFSITI